MAKSAKDYIDQLIGHGLTQSEIAEAVNRDQSLISQIRRGRKPGTNLVTSLDELAKTGQVHTAPARRKTRAGQTAHVRGRRGEPGNVPPEQPSRPTTGRKVRTRVEVPERGRFSKNTVYGRRTRTVKIDFPRTKGTKGREQAWGAVAKTAKSLARRKWGDRDLPERRLYMKVTYADGSTASIGSRGGYSPQALTQGLNAHEGDAEAWAKTQGLGNRYDDLNPDLPLVSIEIQGVKKSS